MSEAQKVKSGRMSERAETEGLRRQLKIKHDTEQYRFFLDFLVLLCQDKRTYNKNTFHCQHKN